MDIKYKQPTAHNCGLFAIANIFNSDEILTEQNLSNPERGGTIFILNEILKEAGKDYHIETLYKNIFNNKLPPEVDVFPSENRHALPLLLTVAFCEDGVNHMIGVRAFSDASLYVYDSLKSEVIETNWIELREMYPIIFGVFAFCYNENDNYVVFEY